MKALVKIAVGPNALELREIKRPKPRPTEVVLLVGAAGICGTDIHILAGEYSCKPPVVLGHEFAGTIVELGKDVLDWSIGDRVTSLAFASVCHKCRHCRAGQYGLCRQRQSYGSGINGAFAEYVAVNASGLYRLPDYHDFISGALSEPLACVTKAVYEIAKLQPGEKVVILGPGSIGLLTLQVARAAGCQPLLVGHPRDKSRLELGRALGAAAVFYSDDVHVVDHIWDTAVHQGADVTFECSGSESAFALTLRVTRKRGRIVQVGLFGHGITADIDQIVYRDLAVSGSFTSSLESWSQAMKLLDAGQVQTRKLVSNIYPLEEWEEAFRVASNGEALKVVFQPNT